MQSGQWITCNMKPVLERIVDVGFSFCLYPNIKRKYSFNFLKNRKLLECRQVSTMVNNMVVSGLWENVILTKIKTYHRWSQSYLKRGTWCQGVVHQLVVLWDPIPTKSWWCRNSVWAPCAAGGLVLWALCSGPVCPGRIAYLWCRPGVWNDLIPYVGQLVLANVPVEGWVNYPYEHGNLDSSNDSRLLPTNYGEMAQFGMMTWGVGMVIDGGRYSEMLLEPVPICSCRLLYVLLITLQPIALVSIYYATFLSDIVPVLWCH